MRKILHMTLVGIMMLICGTAYGQTILWQEDWSTAKKDQTPTDVNPNYKFGDTKSKTRIYDEKLAGGEVPELLVAKSGGYLTNTVDLKGESGNLTLRYKTNKTITVTTTTAGVTVGEATKTGNDYSLTITVPAGTASVELTLTSSTSNNARLDNILFFSGQAKKPAGLSWGTASRDVTIGSADNAFPTLSNSNNLPVTYDCTPAEVATIDKEGNITLVGAGSATVSASFAGNDEYEAQTVSYALNVKAAPTVDIANTPETAYTVEKALQLIEAGEGLDTKVYVKGKITKIDEVSTNYGNATYTLSDDGKDNALLVFRGYYLGGEKFTAKDQIKLGNIIVVNGKLVDYNGTKEITTGSTIYSVNGTTGINAIETTAEKDAPAFNIAGQRTSGTYRGIVIKGGKKFINK